MYMKNDLSYVCAAYSPKYTKLSMLKVTNTFLKKYASGQARIAMYLYDDVQNQMEPLPGVTKASEEFMLPSCHTRDSNVELPLNMKLMYTEEDLRKTEI